MTSYRSAAAVALSLMVLAIGVSLCASPGHSAFFHDGSTLSLMVANVPVLAAVGSLQGLREQRAKVVADMRAIIATAEADNNRDLTAEEIASYDGFEAQLGPMQTRIDRLERLETAEALNSAVRPAVARGVGVLPARAGGPEAAREFETFGQFMHAVRFNPNDQRLNFVEGVGADAMDLSAEMRMDNNATGGFLIPPQLRTTIMSVPAQDALVRPRANVIPAGTPPDAAVTMPAIDQTGNAPGNMYGGVQVQWIGEGDEKPETNAKLREVTLTPHEVAGTIVVTDKLLRNWQAASSFLETLLRGAVTAAEDYAFLRGSGNGMPLGAINAGATYFYNRAVANTVGYLDLVNMVARLLMRGSAVSPVWSMPQSALVAIATLTDPEGHYIWKANAVDGFAGTLLGYPVRWNNRSPAIGSKGDIMLADWSYYLIKDGSGPFVAASEHVLFRQNKTVIKVFWNVDGAPWLTAPIQEENGYQVSPFVGLDVPA